jgi:hypothetical protein
MNKRERVASFGFGNTTFEATLPVSVTVSMRQIDGLIIESPFARLPAKGEREKWN